MVAYHGNGQVVAVPKWVLAIVLPALLGLGAFLFRTTDAKAERAEKATITMDARWVDLMRRLDRIEAKLDRK